MKPLYFLFLFFLSAFAGKAQYVFKEDKLPDQVSILHYAEIADAADQAFTIAEIRNNSANLSYRNLEGRFGNLGFTNHNFWLKFQFVNTMDRPVTYYLETAEPVTDNVNLYLVDEKGQMELQRSGDNIPFGERAVQSRRTLFKLRFLPHEKKSAFMELKNDGEKNSLPLELHNQADQLKNTYHEQMIMGLFYGIMFTIGITYLFFFFALKEITFLYYSLYVICVGICHFSLDGFFHQYLIRDNNWLNLHAVILSAIGGCYFFAKYSEIVLDIRVHIPVARYVFRGLYLIMTLTLLGVVIVPAFLSYSYPVVNLMTLFGIFYIIAVVVTLLVKRKPVDGFYVGGISILFLCFIIVILFNFGFIHASLFSDNLTKIGIALEVMSLSLSMANRIRLLKSKKEELQGIALQRSREMNETKSYFLSNMSHELRTPLNAIIGLTDLMSTEIMDPRMKINFELIRQASGNLISSVNDILDFSKIERGELQLDYIRFQPMFVLDQLRMGFSKQADDKGLSFHFNSTLDQELFVLGDPLRLQQILNNVLNNAIKFTAKGGVRFSIDAKILEQGDFELKMVVADTGEGIPPEKLETVFNVFSQVEVDNKRRFGGFGIGLCIVKALVDLHEGTIQLESTLNKGTSCTIQLSYQVAPAAEKITSQFPPGEYDLLNKHILVAEDNPMNQMVLKMIFRKWKNTRVTFANDGAISLELMQQHDIDIVLMDLQMPVMDGYEAIEAIRSGRAGLQNKDVPIIAITADLMLHTKERVFELGVSDYMTKPVDQALLYEKITAHLS